MDDDPPVAEHLEWLERMLAAHFSDNRMPDMSGDMRKRLSLRRLSTVQKCAKEILAHFNEQCHGR